MVTCLLSPCTSIGPGLAQASDEDNIQRSSSSFKFAAVTVTGTDSESNLNLARPAARPCP